MSTAPTPAASPVSTPAAPTSNASPPAEPTPVTTPSPMATRSPAEGAPDYPRGATDIVLRMDHGGGMVPRGWMAAQAPQFTLYGDGTFLLRPTTDPERPDAWMDGMPRFLHGQMTEEYVQALLGYALSTGRLSDARDFYPQNECADCGNTIFTIDAGGISKTITVDALGMVEQAGPDAVERRGFAQLSETLTDLENRARAGELGEVVLYDPGFYRLTLMESFGEPVEGAVPWPWKDVSPDDFVVADEFSPPTLTVSRADAAKLVEVPSGGHNGIWVEDDEGTLWQVGIRPLLPEEMPAD